MTYSNLAQGVFFFRAVPPPRAARRLCGKRRDECLHRAPGVWPRLLSFGGLQKGSELQCSSTSCRSSQDGLQSVYRDKRDGRKHSSAHK